MGTFTERRSEVLFVKLDPQAKYRAHGRSVYVVLKGEGQVAGEPYRRLTTVMVDEGDDPAFTAAAETEILLLGLPRLGQAVRQAVAAQ